MRLLGKIILWLLIAVAAWGGGLFWFVGQIPTGPAREVKADLIVVLTGGAGRLDYGLMLLADGNAKALFVSGVSKGVTKQDIIRQAAPETQRTLWRSGHDAIFLGDHAVNTIGNAEETKRWLAKRDFETIALVTSNYHMPRSLSEFKEVLPSMTIIPAPVFSDDVDILHWWSDEESRKLILSEYHKYIASKLRHWFVSATHTA